MRETDHLENLGADGRIILKYIYSRVGWGSWIGLICSRIRRDGVLL